MADADAVRDARVDVVAQQFVREAKAVASRASALVGEVRTWSPPPISKEARCLPIEVEVRGFDARVTVAAPADPGSVRGAVEEALRGLGMPRSPR